jgi:hypothetical protein
MLEFELLFDEYYIALLEMSHNSLEFRPLKYYAVTH